MERIRHAVLVQTDRNSAIVLSRDESFTVATDGSFDLSRAWALLKQGASSGEVAVTIGCDVGAIESFVAALRDVGLWIEVGADREVVSVVSALETLNAAVTMWKRHSVIHPIFRLLEDEQRRSSLLISLMVEVCHFTAQTPRIGCVAAAYASSSDGRRRLLLHAADEQDHYIDLTRAVGKALSVDGRDILSSQPAIATTLICSYLEHLARNHVPAYAACLQFLEADPGVAEKAHDAFTSLATKNDVPVAVAQAFARHSREDMLAGHASVGPAVIAAEFPSGIPAVAMDEMLNAVHTLKHSFDSLYDALSTEWADPAQSYLLRGAVRADMI
ncbi:hypothetical protein ABZU53_27985 [Micromonospora sp. NPDC005194]|uniref:hypothetical protein n=1 Tax=Micromonospora sp. NPDC005194 TaxID=3156870 RepID=UPI0033B8E942